LKGRDLSEDCGMDGRLILKLIVNGMGGYALDSSG
jgi:hypothetical protein